MCSCSDVVVYLGIEAFTKVLQFGRWLSNRAAHDPENKGLPKSVREAQDDDHSFCNIIVNPTFAEGTQGWVGLGCSLALRDDDGDSRRFCVAHNRRQTWQGLAQDISKRLDLDVDYRLEAWVGIAGSERLAQVQATLKVETASSGIDYMKLQSVTVTEGEWSHLTSRFRISQLSLKKAVLSFEGPGSGTDILVESVAIIPWHTRTREITQVISACDDNPQAFMSQNKVLQSNATRTRGPLGLYSHAHPGLIQNPGDDFAICTPIEDTPTPAPSGDEDEDEDPDYGENIVDNSNLHDGVDGWFPMGNCRLSVGYVTSNHLGASAQGSFVNTDGPTPGEKFLYVSRRRETFEGPAQDITDSVQLFTSYQISAWVATNLPRGTHGIATPQKVNVALDVDGEWAQGAEVTAGVNWTKISGSFRFETEFKQMFFYIQGPDPGMDMKVAGLQIFAVDRLARVPFLQEQTDKVRKRDVVVKLRDSNGRLLPSGTRVSIQQTKNSFPMGSALDYESLTQDSGYRKFFLDHFSWGVFENELKWSETEKEQGQEWYHEADEMVKFCNINGIQMRGHCILWEEEEYVQDWVKNLEADQIREAIQNRFTSLLSRYKGQFKHYDVDNEILHGSFYQDRLGPQALPWFFKLAEYLDPEVSLFVNDYHIIDGWDCESLPKEYIELITFLQSNGANVGGIGVQAHVEVPVGPIIAQALDKLSTLGIPIWFTEIDVSSIDEFVRADDLEVILREAFAHPSVEGCILWGFMEGAMDRENAALIDSKARLTEAGRRLLALQKEWMTVSDGVVDDNGELLFRGFHGDYLLSVPNTGVDGVTFQVVKGDGIQAVDMTIKCSATEFSMHS